MLVTLYAVPAVSLIGTSEFVRGAVLVVLVVAFLRLERLRRRDAPPAAALAAGVAVAALLLAPALDSDEPWWDYESWSQSAAGAKSTTFQWDHDYGPLDWPRDGRELLRIKSPQPRLLEGRRARHLRRRRWVAEANASQRLARGLQHRRGSTSRGCAAGRSTSTSASATCARTTLPIAGSTDAVILPRQTVFQVRAGDLGAGHAHDPQAATPTPPRSTSRSRACASCATAGTTYSTADLERFTHFTVQTEAAPEGEVAPLAGRALADRRRVLRRRARCAWR